MSYEMVIEQVKTLPEQLLSSVSAFIKLLEIEQDVFFSENGGSALPQRKQAFFALAGKMHLDRNAVTELREASLV